MLTKQIPQIHPFMHPSNHPLMNPFKSVINLSQNPPAKPGLLTVSLELSPLLGIKEAVCPAPLRAGMSALTLLLTITLAAILETGSATPDRARSVMSIQLT